MYWIWKKFETLREKIYEGEKEKVGHVYVLRKKLSIEYSMDFCASHTVRNESRPFSPDVSNKKWQKSDDSLRQKNNLHLWFIKG